MYLSPQTIQQRNTKTFDIGNPCPGLRQTQTCGRVKQYAQILKISINRLNQNMTEILYHL